MNYDVFISFKNLDIHTGKPTRDSEIAGELYEGLKAKGLEVFFSNEEVQRRARPDYGTLINEALVSAPVLILVGTSAENVNARWVKEEWDSFRALLNNGKNGHMITVLEGITPGELARQVHAKFATVQSYDSTNIAGAVDMAFNVVARIAVDDRREDDNTSERPKYRESTSEQGGVRVGEYITLGRYPQGANGEVEPLDWKVLAIENGKALLITEMAIDCKQYNEKDKSEDKWEDNTWKYSDLRRWANNEFFDTAFSRAEQRRIAVTYNENEDNPDYGTKGGDDTQDRVFCLSIGEAKKYFLSDMERVARPTVYAKSRGALFVNNAGNCVWWLRSPGLNSNFAAYVHGLGGVNSFGPDVDNLDVAVRLALWLNL